MDSASWRAYFERNRLDRPEPDWSAPALHQAEAARQLARSLSHFQLGESGEGRCLLAEAQRRYPGDADYGTALALFVREEQEHARLLVQLVQRFGGTIIRRHWTHSAFRLMRRALGVHFEIQTLVIAELIGTAYYRLLHAHSPDPALRQACELMLQDEAQHLAFHRDRFSADHVSWLPAERSLWAGQLQLFLLGAAEAAWADHRRALLALGATRREFVAEIRAECIAFLT
jgi:hypothetical protein